MAHGVLPPAQIERFIEDIKFPANKENIIQYAQDKSASNAMIDVLKDLPDQEFNSSGELKKTLDELKRQFNE